MALLDEWMEQKVDEACEAVPAYVNPRKIRLASSHAGWRLYLYGSSIKRAVCGFFVHIKTADDMDLFLRETAERSDTTLNHIKRFFREKARLLAVLDDAGMRLRFVPALFLFGCARWRPACCCCLRRWNWAMSRFARAFGSDICFPWRFACWRWPRRWRIISRSIERTA